MHSPDATALWSGVDLFTGGANVNFVGFGDSLRICYGLDVTQGGRNWSGPGSTTPGPFGKTGDLHPGGGMTENTWMRIHQGFAGAALMTPNAGISMGFVSVQAGTTTELAGDACFSPFFKLGATFAGTPGVETGGHKVGAVANLGRFAGTGVASEPIIWELTINWSGSPALLENHIGDDSGDIGITAGPANGIGGQVVGYSVPARGLGNPLLSNVIFEVQGPLNGPNLGFLGNQYYLSSTVEFAGTTKLDNNGFSGRRGYGGVANGNSNWGAAFFGSGLGQDFFNMVSATRFFENSPLGFTVGNNPRIPTPLVSAAPGSRFRDGRNEFFNSLAFRTPRAWAYHNFKTGFGGAGTNFHVVGPNHFAPMTGGPGSAVVVEGRDGDNGFQLFTGNGGPDWRISGAPVSNVDIIAIDHSGGADVNFNVYKKVGTYVTPSTVAPTPVIWAPSNPTYAHAAAGFNTTNGTISNTMPNGFFSGTIPCFFQKFNRMIMFFSVDPAEMMLQIPGSWDNMGASMGIQGEKSASTFVVREGGFQTGSINPDGVTPLLDQGATLFGSRFRESDDFFMDGALDYGGNPLIPLFASIFEGGAVPMTSGQSDFKPANKQTTIAIPDATLKGVQLFVSIAGTHIDICNGDAFERTEFNNALTISLQ